MISHRFSGAWLGVLLAASALAQPVILRQPAHQALLAGEEARFVVLVTGGVPLTYQWQRDGVPVPGGSGPRLMIPLVEPDDAGAYSVVVRDASGATTSEEAILTVEIPQSLFGMTQRWRYNDSGQDPGPAWSAPGFDDSAWPEGPGLLFRESASLPAPKSTPLAVTNAAGAPINAYYFRTRFQVVGTPAPMFLIATNLVDDGAVFFLNGVEIGRLRLPPGAVTPETVATPAPEGLAKSHAWAVTNLVEGDNVLAVEVHQHADAEADVVFGMAAALAATPPQLGDLVVWAPGLYPRVLEHTFSAADCEVEEGLVAPGKRRLLSFATETRNVGTADIVVGAPGNNPEFVYHECHAHFHYDGYTDYRLVDMSGRVAVAGGKASSALLDIDRWDNAGPVTIRFGDNLQGIQRGWADIYADNYSGQYLDITDVPPGRYYLELEVDPDQKLPELNENNNLTRVAVEIPEFVPAYPPPLHDDFDTAPILTHRVASATTRTDSATRESGEPTLFAGPLNGHSVWFHWVAPYTGTVTIDTEGSDFATLAGIYRGPNLRALTRLARDYDSGPGLTSRMVASVSAGNLYSILVDGFFPFRSYRPAFGEVVLNINANANDDLANAQPLSAAYGTITGTTARATREAGEPAHGGYPEGRSIWYQWTSPQTGLFSFNMIGSRFESTLAIYTENGSALNLVDRTSGGEDFTWWAEAGRRYLIAVDGRNGASGIATLNWSPAVGLTAPLISGDLIQFSLLGTAEDRCVIETSPDLTHWTPWLRVTNATGSLAISDSLSNVGRHYRAILE